MKAPTEENFRRLSPLTPVARSGIVLIAVVGATWREIMSGEPGIVALILVGVLAAGAVYGFASWVRTKYWIEGDELRIDTGVVMRQSRRIRIDRLQGIDIVQPFLARLLGLAELKMDVASGNTDGSLAFMPVAEANDLKELLLARRDAVAAPAVETDPETGEPAPTAPPRPVVPDVLLHKLDLRTLLVSLVLSFEFFSLISASAAFVAVASLGGPAGALTGFVPVVLGLALVGFRKLSGFYRFTVSDTAAGLQVRRGLFELTSQTIALHRVQGVVITEPLLWRGQGWARLDVSVAGAQVGDSGSEVVSTTVVPVAPLGEVLRMSRHVLRQLDPAVVPISGIPDRAMWVEPLGQHFAFAGLDDHLVISRSGLFARRTHVVPHRRVQSVRVRQGPLMRRLRLADVHVDSPPGPVHVRMRLRDEQDARRLFERAVVLGRQARTSAR